MKTINNPLKKALLFAGIAFAANMAATVPSNVPTSGLIGYWSLAGNGTDETGNNTCAAYNAAGTTDRYGVSGAASTFNGSSSYVEINNNSALSGMSDLSISLWVKAGSLTGTQALVSKWWQYLNCGGNTDNYVVALNGSNVQFATNNNNVYALVSPPSLASSDIGEWRHLVTIYDHSAGSISVYVDGWLIHSESVSGSGICSSTNQLVFGADVFGHNHTPPLIWRFFNGGLDDIGIWNRVLSDCEILGLYAPEARAYQSRPASITNQDPIGLSQNHLQMSQNEPNPFNLETKIEYSLPSQEKNGRLVIYDLNGAEVLSVPLKQAENSVTISSGKLAAGIYMYTILADERKVIATKRMIVTGK